MILKVTRIAWRGSHYKNLFKNLELAEPKDISVSSYHTMHHSTEAQKGDKMPSGSQGPLVALPDWCAMSGLFAFPTGTWGRGLLASAGEVALLDHVILYDIIL
jgi:hypothetical protein